MTVDDKAEVAETPDQAEARVQRQLQYDEAVNQAFPDDMYSQQLANGLDSGEPSLHKCSSTSQTNVQVILPFTDSSGAHNLGLQRNQVID